MDSNRSSPTLLPRSLTISSAGFLVVLLGMIVCGALGTPQGSTPLVQLHGLVHTHAAYNGTFMFASTIPVFALMVTGLLVALGARAFEQRNDLAELARLGMLILAAYAPLSAAAYASQYTVLPALLVQEPASALPWFFYAPGSAVLTMDLLAYAILGVGWCLVAPLMLAGQGAWQVVGWSLSVSGITSIAAFLLHVAGSGAATQLSTFSGACCVPLSVGGVVLGLKAARPVVP